MMHQVMGWSGVAVEGGAGIKAALLQDPDSEKYRSATNPLVWWGQEEVDELERRRVLTRLDLRRVAIKDGVVLYATSNFINPRERDRLILHPAPMVLHPVGPSLIWVDYMPLADAVAKLRRWGVDLLSDARAQLTPRSCDTTRRLGAERALDDARRARFCISAREDRDLRYELFSTMAVASRCLDQSLEPVYLDASIDLPDKLEDLRREVDAFESVTARVSDLPAAILTDLPVPPLGRPGRAPRVSTAATSVH